VTLALNVLVVAGKLVAGPIARSLSVISDAIYSSVDSLNKIRWLGGNEVGHRSA
jgi:divalent metal cation (Fe/Co/Zn/Cd) transporter